VVGSRVMVLEALASSSTGRSKWMVPIVPWRIPLTGAVVMFCNVALMVRSAKSVCGRGSFVTTRGACTRTSPDAERKTFCQMPVSRSRMAGIQSQPMVERKVGPSSAVMPPLPPMPARMVCSCGTPGWGCGVMRTAMAALPPALT